MKELSPLFAASLRDPAAEVADAFVWRLGWGEDDAVLRTISASPDRGPFDLDVGDGDGVQRFEPFPIFRSAVSETADLTVQEITLRLPNVELLLTRDGGGSTKAWLRDLVLGGLIRGTQVWLYQVNLKNRGLILHSRWDLTGGSNLSASEVLLQGENLVGRCARAAPHTIVQAGCNNALYDAWCAVDPDSYDQDSSVVAGSRVTCTSGLTAADYYYDLGKILFTSGRNLGHTRAVGKYTNAGGTVQWTIPLPHSLAPGDQFTIWPGCPKTWAICDSRFSNTANFRGFPNIPHPEAW